MRVVPFLLALAAFSLAPGAAQAGALDEAAIARGLAATEAGRYERALAEFQRVIDGAPERPEGYFFQAAVHQILVGHFDRPAYRKAFEESAARALERAGARVRKNPKDARAQLLLGLTEGVFALVESNRGRYLQAFRRGRRALRGLRKALALDPGLEDAYYGLGLYHYMIGRLFSFRFLRRWTGDSAEKGLGYLRRAAERGRWLKGLARIELVWALYGEKRFREGREALAPLLDRYREQPLYSFAWAEGFFMEEKYRRARAEYAALRRRMAARPGELARLYADFAEWRLARCDFELGRFAEAARRARRVRDKPDMDSPLLRRVRVAAALMVDHIEEINLTPPGEAAPEARKRETARRNR